MTQIINHNNPGVMSNTNVNNSNYVTVSSAAAYQVDKQPGQLADDSLNNAINLKWINKEWIQRVIRVCALVSFISICAITPETLKSYEYMRYVKEFY